jgi:hypothetical protein
MVEPWHATGLPHCPIDVQVATAFPEHWVWFGAQTPVHAPFTQA